MLKLPHSALAHANILAAAFAFLDLSDLASANSFCSHYWKRGGAHLCKTNAYWRNIARTRWSSWAESIEQALGLDYDYRTAVRDQLRERSDLIFKHWSTSHVRGTNPRLTQEDDELEEIRPSDGPMICLLAHRGRLEANPIILSALSHGDDIPPPVFQRYEKAVIAMYEDTDTALASTTTTSRDEVIELPSIPVNVSVRLEATHEDARKLVKKIYLTEDGKLLAKRPRFGYSDDLALCLAMRGENKSPVQIHNGLVLAQSLGL